MNCGKSATYGMSASQVYGWLSHADLWAGQWAFWQAGEQYFAAPHPAHFTKRSMSSAGAAVLRQRGDQQPTLGSAMRRSSSVIGCSAAASAISRTLAITRVATLRSCASSVLLVRPL